MCARVANANRMNMTAVRATTSTAYRIRNVCLVHMYTHCLCGIWHGRKCTAGTKSNIELNELNTIAWHTVTMTIIAKSITHAGQTTHWVDDWCESLENHEREFCFVLSGKLDTHSREFISVWAIDDPSTEIALFGTLARAPSSVANVTMCEDVN